MGGCLIRRSRRIPARLQCEGKVSLAVGDLADELAEEIGRAHVLAKGRHPKHIVCMNSEVEIRDDTTGKVRRVALVYPEDADIAQGKVSVLTPVGTALIGLQAGPSITWVTSSGELRQLTVLAVRDHHR